MVYLEEDRRVLRVPLKYFTLPRTKPNMQPSLIGEVEPPLEEETRNHIYNPIYHGSSKMKLIIH